MAKANSVCLELPPSVKLPSIVRINRQRWPGPNPSQELARSGARRNLPSGEATLHRKGISGPDPGCDREQSLEPACDQLPNDSRLLAAGSSDLRKEFTQRSGN